MTPVARPGPTNPRSSAATMFAASALAFASTAGCRRNGAPYGAASARRKSPKGRAKDARTFAASTWTCCQRTSGARSRTRRAGCPEGAPSGVCFFGYFRCASTAPQERREQRSRPRSGGGQDARSQESDPLPEGERKLCYWMDREPANAKIKMDSGFRRNDERRARFKMNPGLRRNDGPGTVPCAS